MEEVRGAYNILVGRPEGRRPLGRPRRRWEDNISMDLWEIGFGDVDWIHWVGFEVLTAVSMKIAVFWVVAPCSLVEVAASSSP
jgi:hypothetical protein